MFINLLLIYLFDWFLLSAFTKALQQVPSSFVRKQIRVETCSPVFIPCNSFFMELLPSETRSYLHYGPETLLLFIESIFFKQKKQEYSPKHIKTSVLTESSARRLTFWDNIWLTFARTSGAEPIVSFSVLSSFCPKKGFKDPPYSTAGFQLGFKSALAANANSVNDDALFLLVCYIEHTGLWLVNPTLNDSAFILTNSL